MIAEDVGPNAELEHRIRVLEAQVNELKLLLKDSQATVVTQGKIVLRLATEWLSKV